MSQALTGTSGNVILDAPAPPAPPSPIPSSRAAVWGGWIIGGIPALFLLLGASMNLARVPAAVEGAVKMGYPEPTVLPLGVVLLASTLLYLLPRTGVLGAVLLTGWLGGAVATHVRANDPLFNLLFPVVFGALLWGGLWLRDRRLRALLPLRRNAA